MNRELSAQAFTHRNHIYYGAGKAPAKDELTGHELTHAVQQTGGGRASSLEVCSECEEELQRQPNNLQIQQKSPSPLISAAWVRRLPTPRTDIVVSFPPSEPDVQVSKHPAQVESPLAVGGVDEGNPTSTVFLHLT